MSEGRGFFKTVRCKRGGQRFYKREDEAVAIEEF
jgi:hypothetical protein